MNRYEIVLDSDSTRLIAEADTLKNARFAAEHLIASGEIDEPLRLVDRLRGPATLDRRCIPDAERTIFGYRWIGWTGSVKLPC